jgi:hypothetical protein
MIMSLAKGFGIETESYNEEYASENRGRRTSISSKASKITPRRKWSVPLEELENTWRLDPITFNSINKNVQMILAA